ncbi:MAG: TraR/DksA C4-type zinc finger protein [Bacteroides sp.]|nr:MAG: TraR/DksA C4-type zinc finger protein [Bacteroides sp.]
MKHKSYSQKELNEFKIIITKKISEARKELVKLTNSLNNMNNNGTEDTANSLKNLEDSSLTLEKEQIGYLASRQKKFIANLELALIRIENKTYGICRITGNIIPKSRLILVPHTTLCIEAKNNMYFDRKK